MSSLPPAEMLPNPGSETVPVLWLQDPDARDARVTGAKAARLAHALAHGFRVPPGFSVPARSDLRVSAHAIRDAYRKLAIQAGIPEPPVAVRSSGQAEDGKESSYAGQHDTVLAVRGEEALLEATRVCRASGASPRARAYARQRDEASMGGEREFPDIAVLVQLMVPADASLVAFSLDPVTGRRDRIVVESVLGLGEALVSGEAVPDRFELCATDGAVLAREIRSQGRMVIMGPDRTGTHAINVPAVLASTASLEDRELRRIWEWVTRLAGLEGAPVDVEACLVKGRLHLLQVRPVTAAASGQDPQMVEGGVPERSSEAPPPGSPIETPAHFPVDWERPDDGTLHWQLADPSQRTALALWVSRLPSWGLSHGYRLFSGTLDGRKMRRIHTYAYTAPVPVRSVETDRTRRAQLAESCLDHYTALLDRHWTDTWEPAIQTILARWSAVETSLPRMPDPALACELVAVEAEARRLWEIHFEIVTPMHEAIRRFESLARDLFDEHGGITGPDLLAGGDNLSLALSRALARLARTYAGTPELAHLMSRSGSEVAQAVSVLPKGGEEGPLSDLARFLETFGRRPVDPSNPLGPTWREDPTPALELLRMTVAGLVGQGPDPERILARRRREQRRLTREARQQLSTYPRSVVERFETSLRLARVAVRLKEDHNAMIDQRVPYQLRTLAAEAARRLVRRGLLADPGDIVHVTPERLIEGLRGGLDLRADVHRDRDELKRWAGIEPPAELGTRPALPEADPARVVDQAISDPTVRKGQAASRGLCRGVVRIPKSLRDSARIGPGDILVVPAPSPQWAPLFAVAGALVAEEGGMLSHAAIVAREYGIPAVLGVGGLIGWVADGDVLEVDGIRGTVRKLPNGTAFSPLPRTSRDGGPVRPIS